MTETGSGASSRPDQLRGGELRVAVVGAGGIGAAHIAAVPKVHGYRLVAVCDVVADRARAVARQAGVQAFEDPGTLFASGVADIAVIASPPAVHGPLVSGALEAGLHVYCEKPLVPTAAEGRALGAEARRRGLRVQVGFQNRFQPAYHVTRRLLHEDRIGRIFRANLFATHWFRTQSYFDQSPWRGRWDGAAGGVLVSQSIHQLDAFTWMAGLPSRVTARAWRARHRIEVEDDLMAMLEFEDGARGVLVTSTTDPIGDDRLEFQGELGALVVEGEGVRVARLDKTVQQTSDEGEPFMGVPYEYEPVSLPARLGFEELLIACHEDLVAAIREDRDPLNHPDEASRSIELANALYMSAVLDRPVTLPLDGDAYGEFYARLCSGELSVPSRPGVRTGLSPALEPAGRA